MVIALVLGASEAWCAAPFEAFLRQTANASAEEMVSPEIEAEPDIDGLLNEACWQAAQVSGFYRIQKNDRAEEQTVSMATHGRRLVYVAFAIADRDIAAKERKRDRATWGDDCVELFLDPQRARPGLIPGPAGSAATAGTTSVLSLHRRIAQLLDVDV